MSALPASTLAALTAAAKRTAKPKAANAVCKCGHAWADHIGHAGCLECDDCRERKPHPNSIAGGAR